MAQQLRMEVTGPSWRRRAIDLSIALNDEWHRLSEHGAIRWRTYGFLSQDPSRSDLIQLSLT